MAQKQRTWKCDCEGCGGTHTEEKFGDGAPGWGQVLGILKDEQPPYLCPGCLDKIKDRLMRGDL